MATSGVNGTTSALLADFNSVLSQVQASGQLTRAQVTSPTALANQGFRIAQNENLIEQAAWNTPNTSTFLATQIQFDGQTMTPWDLHGLIGSVPASPSAYTDPFTYASPSNPETTKFINLYNDAVSSGALSNPDLQAYVKLFATQVAFLSEVTEDAVATMPSGIDPHVYIDDFETSESTHLDSTNICQAGAGEVTNNTCTPVSSY